MILSSLSKLHLLSVEPSMLSVEPSKELKPELVILNSYGEKEEKEKQ